MKKEYKVEYELKIVSSGLFGLKEVITSGIEIVEAESYSEVQRIMEEKMKCATNSGGGGVAILPSIKSIEIINPIGL